MRRRIPTDDVPGSGVREQRVHLPVDGSFVARAVRTGRKFRFREIGHRCARAIRKDDLHGMHVVGGHAIADGVAARRVVGHDAAHGRPVRTGRIGTEQEAFIAQESVQMIEHNARLHRYATVLPIQIQDPVQVPRDIDDNASSHGLSGQTAAGRTRRHRDLEPRCFLHDRLHLIPVLRNDHGRGFHVVDTGIRGVEHPLVFVRPDGISNAPLERRHARADLLLRHRLCCFHTAIDSIHP